MSVVTNTIKYKRLILLRPDQLQQKRTGGYELVWATVALSMFLVRVYITTGKLSLSDFTQEKVYNSRQQDDWSTSRNPEVKAVTAPYNILHIIPITPFTQSISSVIWGLLGHTLQTQTLGLFKFPMMLQSLLFSKLCLNLASFWVTCDID